MSNQTLDLPRVRTEKIWFIGRSQIFGSLYSLIFLYLSACMEYSYIYNIYSRVLYDSEPSVKIPAAVAV